MPAQSRIRSLSSVLTLLLSSVCGLFPSTALAAPSITLSKRVGPPTSKILVSGSGFAPNVGVDIFFDTKDEALIVTDGQGRFHNASIHAPRSAFPGAHWVTALERNNDKGAQDPFVVNTNWSQFHFDAGGTRSNPYENVLDPANVRALSLAWSYPVGSMFSSPTVVDGIVYIGSSDFNVYALNAHTGALMWSYATGYEVSSTPVVANGIVYFGSWDQNVYALNAQTGIKLWSYVTGRSVESSPAVANGVLYVGSDDDNIYALNAQTGAELWRYTTRGPVVSSPAVAKGRVYVASYDDNVYALDARTGANLWSYGTPRGSLIESGPTVANGVVYFGSEGSPSMYALNASTGVAIWTRSLGAIFSVPAVANGIVYVGVGYDLNAIDANTGVVLWLSGTKGSVNSSAAVADGVVYFGSWDDGLYAANAQTGVELWRYTTGDSLSSSPTVANGMVYVGSRDGNIYAFGPADANNNEPHSEDHPDFGTLHPDLTLQPSIAVVSPDK